MKHTLKLVSLSLSLFLLLPVSALLIANLKDEALDQRTQNLLEKAATTPHQSEAFRAPYSVLIGLFATNGQDPEATGRAHLDAHTNLKFWQVRSCRDQETPERDRCVPKLPNASSPAHHPPAECRSLAFCKELTPEALSFEAATAHITLRLRALLNFDSIGGASLPIPSGVAAMSLHKAWEIQRISWSIRLAKASQQSPEALQETVASILRDWIRFQSVFSRSLSEPRPAIETSVLTMLLEQNRKFLQLVAEQYPTHVKAVRTAADASTLALDAETILESMKVYELQALQTIVGGLANSPEARQRFSMGLSKIDDDPTQEIKAGPFERFLVSCCLLPNATLNEAVRAMNAPPTEEASTGFRLVNPVGSRLVGFLSQLQSTANRVSEKIRSLNQPLDLD